MMNFRVVIKNQHGTILVLIFNLQKNNLTKEMKDRTLRNNLKAKKANSVTARRVNYLTARRAEVKIIRANQKIKNF